ncbi:hypothetical protein C2845_PM15G02140 [Panicum miliaceum]|uniref:Uncharacterized protein n=1 Tax=Panicum miliaceum TaxID=4540 RepID=A0A3L6Q4B0_PANMI|nr:hypothetical protein C2845_PM15G02140 [Panicum miliaceum]
MSRSVSIETTSCRYLGRAMRKYLATTLASSSGSPRIDRCWMMFIRQKAKSSTGSPSRNTICSYSVRRFWAVDFLTRSSPISIVRIASHAALANALVAVDARYGPLFDRQNLHKSNIYPKINTRIGHYLTNSTRAGRFLYAGNYWAKL